MFKAYEGASVLRARDFNLDIIWGSRSEQEQEVLPVDPADLEVAVPGRIGYYDSTTGTVKFGTAAGALPLWLYTNKGIGAGGLAGASGPAIGINLTNTVGMNFLNGTSERLLRTFEFDTTKNYTVDMELTVDDTATATRGKLTPRTANTQILVGYVARPSSMDNVVSSSTVAFYLDKRFNKEKPALHVRTAYAAASA